MGGAVPPLFALGADATQLVWCVWSRGVQPLLLLLSVPKAFKSLELYQMRLYILGTGHEAMGRHLVWVHLPC